MEGSQDAHWPLARLLNKTKTPMAGITVHQNLPESSSFGILVFLRRVCFHLWECLWWNELEIIKWVTLTSIDFPFLLIIGSLTLEWNYSSSRVHWRFLELLILPQSFFAVTQVTELTPVWAARFGFYHSETPGDKRRVINTYWPPALYQ